MKSGSVIFVVLVVLLVPVIYSSSTLHDACAAPRDPHFVTKVPLLSNF
jgi:hypothetical protein